MSIKNRKGHLSREEEVALGTRWQTSQDPQALALLVETHLGLVIKIAMGYRNYGQPMEELIQEGNLGLVIAARKFDPARKASLVTYATYWIRSYILEFILRNRGPVRIGTTRNQRKMFYNLGKTKRKLEAINGGEPVGDEQLAIAIGVKVADLRAILPRLVGHDISLDAEPAVGDGNNISYYGLIADSQSVNPEEVYAENEDLAQRRLLLWQGLSRLDERERFIIKARRFAEKPKTLAVLAAKFGISRERVRQLELRAMKKLKNIK